MRLTGAQVFDPIHGFVKRDIVMVGERFAEGGAGYPGEDVSGCYAVPGLIDAHSHGCFGYDYSFAGPDELRRMLRYQLENGITSVCPTLMTLPEETLAKACEVLADCREGDVAAVLGVHLEGPFVSTKKLGAQNPAYVEAPDTELFRRLQASSKGMVKRISLAPELPGAMEFIEEVSREVACSVAHTTADYDTASLAFAKGASQVTHLYNAMPPFLHREPGVIGAAFDAAHVSVELITDGVHLHPSVVRASFQLFGEDRVILVSDSMMATGLADGSYELGGLPVTVTGNTARLTEGGSIAGSVTNLMNCVRSAVRMGIPLHRAVKCATVNPAKAIGMYATHGSIEPGKAADLLLLTPELELRAVYKAGRPVTG